MPFEELFPTLVTFSGAVNWTVGFLTTVSFFAILALALNTQWSAGILNFGVAAFFMAGAYASAIFTLDPPQALESYIGGWGAPVIVGWLMAAVAGGVLALLLSIPMLRLRDDFLAIMTIGVAAILRSIANSVDGLVNRARGLNGLPRFLEGIADQITPGEDYRWFALVVALLFVAFVFWLVSRAGASPWGRVLRAVRDNEDTARASGKNTVAFRIQAFVLGGVLMGLAGGLYAHEIKSVAPSGFSNVIGTFFVWTMLIVGGSGNHKGVLLGALAVGFFWFGIPLFQESFPDWLGSRVFQVRQLIIGALIVIFLLWRPQGLLAEQARVSRFVRRARAPDPEGDQKAPHP